MTERDQRLSPSAASPGVTELASSGAGTALRCQWCSVDLLPGATTCPTCGSAGVPDPRMLVPDDTPEPEEVAQQTIELVEWWREDEAAGKPLKSQLSFAETERRRHQTIVFIGAAVLFCAVTGWLAGPLLAGAMESLTGTPVENTSDLRPTGGFLGIMVGFMVGATGGWMIWSGN